MRSTGTPAPTASPTLPARPARAPRGFVAADRCETCEGRGQIASPVEVDGDFVWVVEGGEEVEAREATTCEDCDGAGWVRDERAPAQVKADEDAYRARRQADHREFVAEFGPGPLCGTAVCTCPQG